MIATLNLNIAAKHSTAEPDFLEMLPTIRSVASYAFRHARRAVREELLAEVVANAFAAFRRLIDRGQAALAYPTVLAKYAIRQVRAGRRVGSKWSASDVLSPCAQRCKQFAVQSFAEVSAHRQWQELLLTDRRARPAEVAGFKLDFTEWLKRLRRSKRQVALRLVAGHTTKEVAGACGISPARVSQLRHELHQNWNAFQGEPELDTRLVGA
jgi:hypothetical protein